MGKIADATSLLLLALEEELGLGRTDPNFDGTPERVERAYMEILSGERETEKQLQALFEKVFPTTSNSKIIFCSNIHTYSLCPHHLLPVEYHTTVGYIPNDSGMVLGASKLPRMVEILSKRAVLQETFISDIAQALKTLNPKGVAVVVSGKHMCMTMRGVKQQATFEMSEMSGVFYHSEKTRSEFFAMMLGAKR